jgi:hypothetical protein
VAANRESNSIVRSGPLLWSVLDSCGIGVASGNVAECRPMFSNESV